METTNLNEVTDADIDVKQPCEEVEAESPEATEDVAPVDLTVIISNDGNSNIVTVGYDEPVHPDGINEEIIVKLCEALDDSNLPDGMYHIQYTPPDSQDDTAAETEESAADEPDAQAEGNDSEDNAPTEMPSNHHKQKHDHKYFRKYRRLLVEESKAEAAEAAEDNVWKSADEAEVPNAEPSEPEASAEQAVTEDNTPDNTPDTSEVIVKTHISDKKIKKYAAAVEKLKGAIEAINDQLTVMQEDIDYCKTKIVKIKRI